MTVITLGEAEQEFAESVDYYESNEAGLGGGFAMKWRKRFNGLKIIPSYLGYDQKNIGE
jgi:hypothetical protein